MGSSNRNNERCPECGTSPAEQTPKPLSDEGLRRVAQCVLGILRAETQRESSHAVGHQPIVPTTIEQTPGNSRVGSADSKELKALKEKIETGEYRIGRGIKVTRLDPDPRKRGKSFLTIKPLSTVPDEVVQQVQSFYAEEDAEEWEMIKSVTKRPD